MRNVKLKATMFEKGVTQNYLSQLTGIPRQYISMGIHGRFRFDAEQRRLIARALSVGEYEIFQENRV